MPKFLMDKVNVLWVSLDQFDFPLDETATEKYSRLSEFFNCFVIAISPKNKFEHKFANNSHFYLIPKIGKLYYAFLAYLIMLFAITPVIILKKKINVVVAADPFIPGLILSVWKRILFFKKLGLLVEAFGNWTETPAAALPKIFRWPVRIIIKIVSWFSITAASALRAESDVTLEKLQRYKKCAPSSSFSLMHLELFEKEGIKREEHPNEFHILFIGRIVKLKGVQYVIDIVNEIKDDFPEVRFIVAGDGEYLPELEKQVLDLNLENHVKFSGNLSRQEVKQQLTNCDLFILPSMSEGRPRVLIEAMAMQKPMIATDVGAVSDIVKDNKNGFLVKPNDIESLKEKIVWALKNKDKIKEMGLNNKKILEGIKEDYTMENYVKKYSKILKETYKVSQK